MAVRGQRPKAPGVAVTRHRRLHDWCEVEDTPNRDGPRLPARRRNGKPWPAHVRARWNAWRAMPHTVLWIGADWEFALDTAELAALAAEDDAPAALFAELRARERVLGTTRDARVGQRIRYVPPADPDRDGGGSVAVLDSYRDL